MFKVGKRYKFRMLQEGDETTFDEDVDLTNNPFRTPPPPGKAPPPGPYIRPGRIINVTSPSFVSAIERVPEDK